MINRIGRWFDYLSYLFYSTNRHGVHSPFVYEFVDRVLYKNTSIKNEIIEHLRTLMIQSHSDGFDNYSLSKYVREFTLPSKHCELLQRIKEYYNIELVHDIGPSTGIEINYLRYSSEVQYSTPIKVVSTHKSSNFEALFSKSQSEYLKAIQSTTNPETSYSQEGTDDVSLRKSMFIFHRLDLNTLFWDSFEQKILEAQNDDFFIFCNIYHDSNSYLNWNRMVNHADFHVTIDCFHVGIAIKRQQQVKEHFQLRY